MQASVNEKQLQWIPPLLILYNFCANLANDIYLPSLPKLEHLFQTSSSMLQLTMTSWFAGVAIPQLIFGPLSDRFGRRPVLFAGGVCFLISSAICALATNVSTLIIARFFQGVGVCSLNVATFAILIDLYNYQSRTKIMNKINMVGTMAPLIGPVLGGYVLAFFGWRINFVIIFVMGCISILGLWFKLPESNLYLNPQAVNMRNMVHNYLQLIISKGFLKHLLPYCLILGGLIVYLTAAPFIIIEKLKISTTNFGYTQLPIFTTYILGSIYLGRVKDDAAIKKMLVLGVILVFLAGVMLLASSYLFAPNLILFIVPMMVYSLGSSFCGSPLVNEVMSSATAAKGSAAAFLGFGMAMSCMLSSLCLGLVYNGTVLMIALLIFFIAFLAASIYFMGYQAVTIDQEVTE